MKKNIKSLRQLRVGQQLKHLISEIIIMGNFQNEKVRETSLKVEGITGTEKCMIRKSGMTYHVDLHAMVNAHITVKEGHRLSHELKDRLLQDIPDLGQVLIHIEPDDL